MNKRCRILAASACLAVCVRAHGAAGDDLPPPAAKTTPKAKLDRAEKTLGTQEQEKGVQLAREALAELAQAVKTHPKDAVTRYLLARANSLLREDAEALKQIDLAITLTPRNVEYRLMRARLLVYMDRLKYAEHELTICAAIAPNNTECHLELGAVKQARLKYGEALACYKKAMALAPKRADGPFRAGLLLVEMGKKDQAIEMFAQATRADPTQSAPFYNLGHLLHDKGRLAEAARAFRNMLKIKPESWRAIVKLVQVHQALGQLKQRDATREELLKLRRSGKSASLKSASMYARDMFKVGKKDLSAYEHFELTGAMAVRYTFYVIKPGTDTMDYKITLGSYEMTNAVLRAQGRLKKGQRVFHLDMYRGGGHGLYRMFMSEPSYDEVKALVQGVVEGKVKPLSSTAPAPTSGPAGARSGK